MRRSDPADLDSRVEGVDEDNPYWNGNLFVVSLSDGAVYEIYRIK